MCIACVHFLCYSASVITFTSFTALPESPFLAKILASLFAQNRMYLKNTLGVGRGHWEWKLRDPTPFKCILSFFLNF